MCVCVCACVGMCIITSVALIAVEQRKEPIPLKNFSEHVANMHKDRDLGFEEEYSVCCTTKHT